MSCKVVPPSDEEGYIMSFLPGQEEQYMKFFHEYGFVVIRDALTADEVNNTIDEMWTHETLLGKNGSVVRDDPSTWETAHWPSAFGIAERGFLSFDHDYQPEVCWRNRQNPIIYKVFTNIFGNKELWVTIDRYGIMRPTKNIKLKNGDVVDKPEWITKSNWLHWDQNPWYEPDFVRVQGLIALSNSTAHTGGFHCVPGFPHKFSEWGKHNQPRKGGIINVPLEDPARNEIVKIFMRKGSLLVWDSRLPHGNYPNESPDFRAVQYVTYSVAKNGDEEARLKRLEPFVDGDAFGGVPDMLDAVQFFVGAGKADQSALVYKFPPLTDLGEKLLGAKRWSFES